MDYLHLEKNKSGQILLVSIKLITRTFPSSVPFRSLWPARNIYIIPLMHISAISLQSLLTMQRSPKRRKFPVLSCPPFHPENASTKVYSEKQVMSNYWHILLFTQHCKKKRSKITCHVTAALEAAFTVYKAYRADTVHSITMMKCRLTILVTVI